MRKTRLWLMAIATLLGSLTASAYDFEVDGIYYNIISDTELTVGVTRNGSYSGAVIIPFTVAYNGIAYSVTSIEGEVFAGCRNLTSITIPESVMSIGYGAFLNCSSLTSIIIPESVMSIESEVFGGCTSLTSITVDKGNTIYDSRNGCNAVIETNSNTLIAGCTTTTIPESVTSIGDGAFYNFSSLISITLPEGVTSIGSYAFGGCTSLTSITLPESITSIGDYAFHSCSKLTSIAIPESVASIGNGAFFYCRRLTSITIPESITSIGIEVFAYCSSLTSITIPEGVTSIGGNALSNCSSLTSIACNAVTPPTCGSGSFSGVDTSIPVYVPANSVDVYREAEGWKMFSNFIGIETGIADATVDEDADAPIYTMKGMRMNGSRGTLPAGMYIQHGKKFVVK